MPVPRNIPIKASKPSPLTSDYLSPPKFSESIYDRKRYNIDLSDALAGDNEYSEDDADPNPNSDNGSVNDLVHFMEYVHNNIKHVTDFPNDELGQDEKSKYLYFLGRSCIRCVNKIDE